MGGFLDKLEGAKTLLISLVVTLMGVLAHFGVVGMPSWATPENLMVVWGTVMAFMRLISTGPAVVGLKK